MSYSIMSHYLIRSPLLPIERRNKVKGASSFEGKVAFLEDVLDDEARHYIVKCANFVMDAIGTMKHLLISCIIRF